MSWHSIACIYHGYTAMLQDWGILPGDSGSVPWVGQYSGEPHGHRAGVGGQCQIWRRLTFRHVVCSVLCVGLTILKWLPNCFFFQVIQFCCWVECYVCIMYLNLPTYVFCRSVRAKTVIFYAHLALSTVIGICVFSGLRHVMTWCYRGSVQLTTGNTASWPSRSVASSDSITESYGHGLTRSLSPLWMIQKGNTSSLIG